ncbi:hypothetical protein AWU82_29835 [Pseudomonas glycinae]|uniref:BACON domain-containing protein n=1 Tax=Pseudomonas glycinae TaxID=1785145 RepID=A0ABM6QI26_9PSED|nr:hypothetical protein AWU82_29835 [Pseudomonas glycinae]
MTSCQFQTQGIQSGVNWPTGDAPAAQVDVAKTGVTLSREFTGKQRVIVKNQADEAWVKISVGSGTSGRSNERMLLKLSSIRTLSNASLGTGTIR